MERSTDSDVTFKDGGARGNYPVPQFPQHRSPAPGCVVVRLATRYSASGSAAILHRRMYHRVAVRQSLGLSLASSTYLVGTGTCRNFWKRSRSSAGSSSTPRTCFPPPKKGPMADDTWAAPTASAL